MWLVTPALILATNTAEAPHPPVSEAWGYFVGDQGLFPGTVFSRFCGNVTPEVQVWVRGFMSQPDVFPVELTAGDSGASTPCSEPAQIHLAQNSSKGFLMSRIQGAIQYDAVNGKTILQVGTYGSFAFVTTDALASTPP